MHRRLLRLGTRRSALARAQSGQVARQLERLHPGLTVELVGIDTRGDRILDQPLSKVEGKEFFTAEIDAALLRGDVDFTVHSFKDLSLERPPELVMGAVPERQNPRDIALFAPDVLLVACGSFRTLGGYVMKEMADAMCPNVIIPMHYHHEHYGNRRISALEDFTDLYYEEADVIKYPTNTIDITKDMPHQVAVLKYMG